MHPRWAGGCPGAKIKVYEEALFLLERISQTDKLIDALIYEIYGLTEEIGIVEGRG